MGNRSGGLFTVRKLLGLLSARSRAESDVSLGRRRSPRDCGSAMPSLFRTRPLEWKRSDFERATLWPHRFRRQPRRGRKGALLLPRLDADTLVHEGALQISAGRISVCPAD